MDMFRQFEASYNLNFEQIGVLQKYLENNPDEELPLFNIFGFIFMGTYNTDPKVNEATDYTAEDFRYTVTVYPKLERVCFGHGGTLWSAVSDAVGYLAMFIGMEAVFVHGTPEQHLYYTRLGNILIKQNDGYSSVFIQGNVFYPFGNYTGYLFDDTGVKVIAEVSNMHDCFSLVLEYIKNRLNQQRIYL